MEGTALAALGFAAITILLILLFWKKSASWLVFAGISAVMSVILILSKTFTAEEMGNCIVEGMSEVYVILALYIISEVLFEIMKRAGISDRLVRTMIKKIGNRTACAALLSCFLILLGRGLALAGHLDDGGAIALLITIPVLLPVYKHLKMQTTTLLLICSATMGVLSPLPWSEVISGLAPAFEMTPEALRNEVAPMLITGIVAAVGTALIWGNLDRKRTAEDAAGSPKGEDQGEIWTPDGLRGRKMLATILTVLSVGAFLGTFEKTGIMERMLIALIIWLPTSLEAFFPLIIGILSAPLALVFSPDAYAAGLLSAFTANGGQWMTISPEIVSAMVMCRNCAAFISPTAPAVYLGLRFAGVEIREHICSSFFWLWGISLICLISGIVLGIIRF